MIEYVPGEWCVLAQGVFRLAINTDPTPWAGWASPSEKEVYAALGHTELEWFKAENEWGDARGLADRLNDLDASDREMDAVRERYKSYRNAQAAMLQMVKDGVVIALLELPDGKHIEMPRDAWLQPDARDWLDASRLQYPTGALLPERFWEVQGPAYQASILVRIADCRPRPASKPKQDEPARSATIGSEEPPTGPAMPSGRRRGPPATKLNDTIAAMQKDIEQGTLTRTSLSGLREKELSTRYRVSRNTARKARDQVLANLV
jgi:hypothetical protein